MSYTIIRTLKALADAIRSNEPMQLSTEQQQVCFCMIVYSFGIYNDAHRGQCSAELAELLAYVDREWVQRFVLHTARNGYTSNGAFAVVNGTWMWLIIQEFNKEFRLPVVDASPPPPPGHGDACVVCHSRCVPRAYIPVAWYRCGAKLPLCDKCSLTAERHIPADGSRHVCSGCGEYSADGKTQQLRGVWLCDVCLCHPALNHLRI